MAVRPARRLLVLAGALALALVSCRAKETPHPPAELRPGSIVAAALAPGEVHRYRIPLQKGDFLRLTVDQQGIDLVAIFEDPTGARTLRVDRVINDRGLELVLAVAATSGIHTLVLQGPEGGNPGRYEARIEALRSASESDRRSAAAYRSFREAEDLKDEKALEQWTRVLATWRELGETTLEGEVLVRMAQEHYVRREWQLAVDHYRQAAAAFSKIGNPRWEAIARNGLASNLLPLNQTEEAVEQHTLALLLAGRAGDRRNQALALHGLGQARQYQGEVQEALDHYGAALKLWPAGDRMRPNTLHQLGVLYARYLHVESLGGDLLRQARDAWSPEEEDKKAATASQLGRLAYEQNQLGEARNYFKEALNISRQKNRCSSAVYLARLALVEEEQGARPAAESRIAEALRMVSSQSCPRSEPTVRFLGANLAEKRSDPAGAHEGYRRCEQLFADLGDRMGRAESLAGIARAARSLGDLQNAREASRQALDIVEGVRPTVLDEGLRISFFSGAQDWFDAHVDLLLKMGAAEDAWATAEQARARALGDLLAVSGADLHRTAPKALIDKEQALQRQLNVLETRRLTSNEAKPDKLRTIQEAIEAKITELESLRGEIRRGSPLYASLTRSGPASPAVLRRDLLDDDTLLLEYRLGETASTVWAVTRDAVTAHGLPPRSEIEPLAREAASWLQSLEWPGLNPPVLCDLSRMLLAPMADSLGHHRRLAVVADGALEGLPFAALPFPGVSGKPADCARAPLLVDTHETVSLPSAAALLTQRRLLAGRRPAPGWLAVVADPIYIPSQNLPALPGSAQEAAAITSGLPPGKVFTATGPAASRATVKGGALRGFRIVHFATHGTLNAEQPLLSSLALSGGFLPAHEIYDLELPAELMVLSACDTQRGRDVPGEGLVSGLPRAFLYAGAARVLVSLWAVEDQSTRELMVLFYRSLFERGLPPALALQEAQRTLYRASHPPYQWAGFVLLGDWRPLPPFDH